MYDAQDFIKSHTVNESQFFEDVHYSSETLYEVIPYRFGQQFEWDNINKSLDPIWIWELKGQPVAWWDCEQVYGYRENKINYQINPDIQ